MSLFRVRPNRIAHPAGQHRLAGLAAAIFLIALLVAPTSEARARYASIVIDAETGQVLHARNADTRNFPASLTKMMTLYMVFEALRDGRLRLDQPLKVSRRAAGMPPSKLDLRAGRTITVKDAIQALATKSANDAAVVVAEALGGSEQSFARMMTKKARALGMSRTSFRNASGLPNRRQLSTARDMARLGQALLQDFPQHYHYFSMKSFAYKGRSYRNHNRLLRTYKGTDGIKTGYIRASGFNLVASAVRDGRRLIAVVFGGKTPGSRNRHMATLLDRGFKEIRTAAIRKPIEPPRRRPAEVIAAAGETPFEPEPEVATSAAEGGLLQPRQPAEIAQAPEAVAMLLPRRKPLDAVPEAMPESRTLAARGRFGVQVGAYYRYNPAKRAAKRAVRKAPDLLAETRTVITQIRGRRGKIFQARLVGLSENRAETACRKLASAKIDCLVVQTGRGISVALQDMPQGAPAN